MWKMENLEIWTLPNINTHSVWFVLSKKKKLDIFLFTVNQLRKQYAVWMNLEKTLPLLFRYKSKNDLAKITKSEKSLGGKVYIFF